MTTFRMVGGPHDGTVAGHVDLENIGYLVFNDRSGGKKSWYKRTDSLHPAGDGSFEATYVGSGIEFRDGRIIR